ncbi:D-amino acid aminotransferase [Rubripirellula lacrimiformis]|uniref:D-amino acid aminotransferase n=1 Tax=Rubripirellula lacrimiformis TaxID=1930273 RepID=A0A517NHX0_9BACT|nr:aminotransferase class IV [Rubripirellula lacrimiformis]QDT06653.1 D-amino acid aminotransferase [Rubripirellula lacrimiformis]
MPDSTSQPVGYLCGRWVNHSEMSVSVDDAGFRQAVTVVERLRTYNRVPWQVDLHLRRWQSSLDYLGIVGTPPPDEMRSLMNQLLVRNRDWDSATDDVGITWFATPGNVGIDAADRLPTIGMHLNRLDDAAHRRRWATGQPLVVTSVCQPSPDAWSRSIKTRCRLHYFRADQIARSVHPLAAGVLVDADGSITETSIANLAIVESGIITSPPEDQVLPGVTQKMVQQWAAAESIPWRKQRLTPSRLVAADQVLLMGTDAGLWFASDVRIWASGSKPASDFVPGVDCGNANLANPSSGTEIPKAAGGDVFQRLFAHGPWNFNVAD